MSETSNPNSSPILEAGELTQSELGTISGGAQQSSPTDERSKALETVSNILPSEGDLRKTVVDNIRG